MTVDADQGWRVRPVKQRAFVANGHAWAAVAPGCPAGPHPHRDCECRIFPNLADALDYKSIHENAPAAGGHQREGEDQNTNTHEGEPIMTDTTVTEARSTSGAAAEDHELARAARNLGRTVSDIARDPWATETEVSDADTDPMIVHSHEFTYERYAVAVCHTIADVDLGTDVIVKWTEPGETGGETPEDFSVNASDIPALIAALQTAHESIRAGVPA